jgi:hypothetical protein
MAKLPIGTQGTLRVDGIAAALPCTVRTSGDKTMGLAFNLNPDEAKRFGQELTQLLSRHAA